MILACNNICKTFGDRCILDNCSFHIEDKEKAAIVGANGAGKSTLLKIIMGETSRDSGEVTIGGGKTLGYLSQHQQISGDMGIVEEMLDAKKELLELEGKIRTLEEEMKQKKGDELDRILKTYTRLTQEFERKDGFSFKSEIIGVVKGLGFKEEEFDKPVRTLSGGQKTRVFLGKLLLSQPDILLLDEPINHLDLQSVGWLETYLNNYKGSVLMVAHDRYFLDRVVTKIIEIERSKVSVFIGNYTTYEKKKEFLLDSLLKQYLNQQKEIKAQQEVIAKLRSFNREKSVKRAESREKLLGKIDVLEKPVINETGISFSLEPEVLSGKDVLSISGLGKSFGEKILFEDVDVEIKRGERVAVIGNNGTGKTTLLKIINGSLQPEKGEVKLGAKVNIGYYDQEHQTMSGEKTIFEEIHDAYPELEHTRIRNVLAAFMFIGEDVFKKIKDLSGGERGRVSLAKLMLSKANFIILDEPTNHLDIGSKEILEKALNAYTGTIIYVSHDRYFINKTASRILELSGGRFINYIGNYDYYIEKKLEHAEQKTSEDTENKTEAGKLEWKKQKEEQARERKRQNDIKKTEEKIHQLEMQIKELDKEMLNEEIATDTQRLMYLYKNKEEISGEIDKLYEKWESLM